MAQENARDGGTGRCTPVVLLVLVLLSPCTIRAHAELEFPT